MGYCNLIRFRLWLWAMSFPFMYTIFLINDEIVHNGLRILKAVTRKHLNHKSKKLFLTDQIEISFSKNKLLPCLYIIGCLGTFKLLVNRNNEGNSVYKISSDVIVLVLDTT